MTNVESHYARSRSSGAKVSSAMHHNVLLVQFNGCFCRLPQLLRVKLQVIQATWTSIIGCKTQGRVEYAELTANNINHSPPRFYQRIRYTEPEAWVYRSSIYRYYGIGFAARLDCYLVQKTGKIPQASPSSPQNFEYYWQSLYARAVAKAHAEVYRKTCFSTPSKVLAKNSPMPQHLTRIELGESWHMWLPMS